MIRNGYYYPDFIWKNKPHRLETKGEYVGDTVYNFVVGNRRAGKSVGVGIFALADFIMFGYKSALIRRYDKNFRDSKAPAMQSFWGKSFPHLHEFPDIVKSDIKLQEIYPLELVESLNFREHEIDFRDYHCYIDGELFCYPVMLNKYDDNKNNIFENVHNILYDEFIPETGRSGLSNEFNAVANIYDTIARGRPHALETTGVIFMANSVTDTNEFYVNLKIDQELRSDTKRLYRPERGWCLEVVRNQTAEEEIKNSAFGKMLMSCDAGQSYLNYSQENVVQDDQSFVERIGGDMRYIANFTVDKNVYALKQNELCYYFTDDGVDKNFGKNYALTKEDHTMDTLLISGPLKKMLSYYRSCYDYGLMRFNSMRSKKVFLAIYHLL